MGRSAKASLVRQHLSRQLKGGDKPFQHQGDRQQVRVLAAVKKKPGQRG